MEFVTCPHCGQIQAKTEDGICIKCKRSLAKSDIEEDDDGVKHRCPNCGNIQTGESEICNRCGKSMLKDGSVRFATVYCGIMFLFFACAGCFAIMDLFGSYHITSVMVVSAVGCIALSVFLLCITIKSYRLDKKEGKHFLPVYRDAAKAIREKRESHLQTIGVMSENIGLEQMYISLDESRMRVILETQSKKNILPASQITSVCMVKKGREENKSVVGRSVVGALIGGTTGAVVGAISGVGTKTVYDDYLHIMYYPKDRIKEERDIFLLIQNVNDENYQGFYRRLCRMVDPMGLGKREHYL